MAGVADPRVELLSCHNVLAEILKQIIMGFMLI